MADSQSSKIHRRVLSVVLFALLVGIVAALTWRGWDFYRLSLEESVEHKDFRVLRPSGLIGHGYGFLGTFLIATNLLYLLRRKLARMRLGSMRAWLDLHVFTGLVGSVFVLFHSAFQLRTPIATITTVSLLIVVVTGLLGRYIYALAPRRDDEGFSETLAALNSAMPGIGGQLSRALAALPGIQVAADASLLRKLVALLRWRGHARDRRQLVELTVHSAPAYATLPRAQQRQVNKLARQVAREAAAQSRAEVAESVVHSWRSMHRFFAILMLLMVSIHIYIAWLYGYRWIFSE